MNTMIFLIGFPIVIGLLLLFLPQQSVRKWVVGLSAAAISVASVLLVAEYAGKGTVYLGLENYTHLLGMAMLAIEVVLALIILTLSLRHKQYIPAVLMAVSAVLAVWFELTHGSDITVSNNLFVDNLSLIMTLIIGIIGSMIAVYALGYMKDYHDHHPEMKNRTPFFFFIVFIFLGSMFGLVYANNLLWLYFFWEITTLCSFFLIGYSKEDVAIKNSFRALTMNLLGGVAFLIAIVYLHLQAQTVELSELSSLSSAVVLIPVALLAFSGITKSAQMPFSSWLLGAMVAPTPVSALLHSSTMVKAGVYLILRLSPVFALTDGGSSVGLFVALVGAVTFLLTSIIAVTQNDAKRVLAYSTIANLGLIVLCAGIGSPQLLWAAIMIVIFHAIAKSLLFLSVGTVEHNLGSRMVESMDGLVSYMPKLAVTIAIGIAGMFLAPFGMLISKWAALEGLISAHPLLTIFIAFGSATTIFYWTKWLGKILMVKSTPPNFKANIPGTEQFTLTTLAVMVVTICMAFPLISTYFIEPMLQAAYGQSFALGHSNIAILLLMIGLILVLPLQILRTSNKVYKPQYMSGANVAEKEMFHNSFGASETISFRSLYLDSIFKESLLFKAGVVSSIVLILAMFGVGLI